MAPATKPKRLAEALLRVQAEVPKLQKDSINPHFGNKYISLDSLMPQILPVLQKNQLLLVQSPSNIDGAPALRTQLVFVGGDEEEHIEDTMPLVLDKQNSQGQGSAITYARRYALMSLLSLVADQDDDGNAASKPAVNATPAQPGETAVLAATDPVALPDGLGGSPF